MATRRDVAPVERDLRSELLGSFLLKAARYRDRVVGDDGVVFVAPWARVCASLEAGDPVDVYAYSLPRWAREFYGIRIAGRVRVGADGRVEPLGAGSS